jgi:hypothetical protein
MLCQRESPAPPDWTLVHDGSYLPSFVRLVNEGEVSAMSTVSDTTAAQCEVAGYTILTGYMSLFPPGVIADEPKRVTTLQLHFVQHDPAPTHELSFALVKFVDDQAGSVRSLGKVFGFREAEIFLPRDEFPAFWHAIRDAHAVIEIRWNVNEEVIEFLAHGSERVAPNPKESQADVDSLRQKLSADTGN